MVWSTSCDCHIRTFADTSVSPHRLCTRKCSVVHLQITEIFKSSKSPYKQRREFGRRCLDAC